MSLERYLQGRKLERDFPVRWARNRVLGLASEIFSVSLVHVLRAQPISDAAHTSASRIWLVVRGVELVATRSIAREEPSGSEAWTRLSRWILEEPPTWTSERNNLGGRNFSRFPLSQSATKKNSRASGVAWGSWIFFRSSWTWGTAADTKRTTVGDRRVLNSKCPKRLARI